MHVLDALERCPGCVEMQRDLLMELGVAGLGDARQGELLDRALPGRDDAEHGRRLRLCLLSRRRRYTRLR
jgi:hypothetical protein